MHTVSIADVFRVNLSDQCSLCRPPENRNPKINTKKQPETIKVLKDHRSRNVGITIALTILTNLSAKPGPALQVQIKAFCPLSLTEAFLY